MPNIGRFAPSPTGPLHPGSLVAAVGSYLHARARGGQWLVRIEDVDEPRTVAGAASDILRALEAHALFWDGPVLYQSTRKDAYRAALESLKQSGHAFPCACSRRDLIDGAYPGTCRDGIAPGKQARSWRFRGEGDFILLRADGYFAYQLAVVVDDAYQLITDVVRGEDLLDSTPGQIALQTALRVPTPRYVHLPLVRDEQGEKLSKQTRAPAIVNSRVPQNLQAALAFLGIAVPPTDPRDMLTHAVMLSTR